MENKKEKPLSMIIAEARNGIVRAVNFSGLPACIASGIVHEIYLELLRQAEAQYTADKQEWNEPAKDKPEK